MANACVRTDNMAGTTLGKYLCTFEATADMENGSVVVVGKFKEGEREIREYSTHTGKEKIGQVALIATPEVVKDKTYNSIADFKNATGDLMRGYIIDFADVFSLTKEGFAEGSDFTVGNIVELAAGTKLKAVKTATEGMTQVGVLGAVENGYYPVDVVKA